MIPGSFKSPVPDMLFLIPQYPTSVTIPRTPGMPLAGSDPVAIVPLRRDGRL